MTMECGTCGAQVIPAGEVTLDAQPDRFGIYTADGRRLSEREWRDTVGRGEPIGRRKHICGRPTQGALFAAEVGL